MIIIIARVVGKPAYLGHCGGLTFPMTRKSECGAKLLGADARSINGLRRPLVVTEHIKI